MPELPEVEVVRLQLEQHLIQKPTQPEAARLHSVQFFRPDLRFPIPQKQIQNLVGKSLAGLSRHGKYLIFEFEGKKVISHLGMTGTWRFVEPSEPRKTHDHVIFGFQVRHKKKLICYNDPRRFGFLDYADTQKESQFLAKLGLDALLSSQKKKQLFLQIQNKEAAIKNLLLDQSFLAGVGNIYASEALFLSRIHPTTPANQVSRQKWDRLCNEIPKLLQTSIELGGSSIDDFHGVDEKSGSYQDRFWVYDRENESCKVCRKPIEFLKMGQRSTYYCARCQK